jgi:SsrA-binding protein
VKDTKAKDIERQKIIVNNRKARFEYEIIDSIEAGIVLLGSEVKSLREGKANISDSYARIKDGELWIIGMHISHYKQNTINILDPLRDRKLLLHKNEIKRLARRVEEKGMTLVPLRLYFNQNIAKIELGIARGKRQYDKKATIAEKDAQRDLEREQKKYKFKL